VNAICLGNRSATAFFPYWEVSQRFFLRLFRQEVPHRPFGMA
jgi:hypothetical protein